MIPMFLEHMLYTLDEFENISHWWSMFFYVDLCICLVSCSNDKWCPSECCSINRIDKRPFMPKTSKDKDSSQGHIRSLFGSNHDHNWISFYRNKTCQLIAIKNVSLVWLICYCNKHVHYDINLRSNGCPSWEWSKLVWELDCMPVRSESYLFGLLYCLAYCIVWIMKWKIHDTEGLEYVVLS